VPIQLHIATTNTCNGKCHFCVYPKPENTLPKGVMKMELFHKIIDEAAGHPDIDSIAFSALGEPLLDPHLVERVAYVRAARDWNPVELYTNGVFLTPAKFDALRIAGLTHCSISLNAVSQEQHTRIMGIKGKFDTVRQNIIYAINNRGSMEVLVKAVRNDDQFTLADQIAFYMSWGIRRNPQPGGPIGHGDVVYECNWGGKNRLIAGRTLDPNSTCGRAVGQFSVLQDGTVTLCCYDPLAEYPFGDMKTQTIKEVYNSEKYVEFRTMHVEERAAEHPLCAKCTRV